MDALINNWEAITAGAIIVLASVDKVVMVAINSLGHVRDAWRSVFPNNTDDA
jgi:hypothetical protein